MKTLKSFLVLFAFAGLLLVGCSDQSQSPVSPTDQISLEKKTIHYFTIKDFPIPPPYPYNLDPGVKQYLPNGDIHYKKVGLWEKTEARDLDGNIDPLITGLIENYLSTMIDGETGDGPANGKTVSANVPGQEVKGFWETNWEGYRTYVGKAYFNLPIGYAEYHYWSLPINMVGHGKGGQIDKMQMKVEGTITIFSDDAHFPEPIFWLGNGSGFYK